MQRLPPTADAIAFAAAAGEYFYRHAIGRLPTRSAHDARAQLRAAADLADAGESRRAFEAIVDAAVVGRLVYDDGPVARDGDAAGQSLALDLLSIARAETRST